MKKLFMMSLMAFSTLLSAAQKPVQIKLWEGEHGTIVNERPTVSDWIAGEDITEATLTVYPAPKPNGQAIVACPGGGYAGIAVSHEGHDMAAWFNAQGITYAVLHYRMPNGNVRIPLSDAQQAIRVMRGRAKEWDIKSLGIMGASAGGHLACTAATHFTPETRPDFQVLFYPVVTMGEKTHQGSRKNLLGESPSAEQINLFSNEKQVTPQTPPAFIMHSTDDKTVPVINSVNYYLALVQNGVSATMHLYPIGGHGWGYRDNFLYKTRWTGELEKWLREINK